MGNGETGKPKVHNRSDNVLAFIGRIHVSDDKQDSRRSKLCYNFAHEIQRFGLKSGSLP